MNFRMHATVFIQPGSMAQFCFFFFFFFLVFYRPLFQVETLLPEPRRGSVVEV